jgi:aspartyl-tRNA(Asn)/glutamyl-tRNA(Gln) amidotransferase subunit A
MYLNDIFTVTVNMAGLPGISVPAGFSKDGLPLGLQIIGRPFDEETVLRAGQIVEDAAGIPRQPDAWWRLGVTAPAAATKPKRGGKPPKKKS